jgi:hypothetical protein
MLRHQGTAPWCQGVGLYCKAVFKKPTTYCLRNIILALKIDIQGIST